MVYFGSCLLYGIVIARNLFSSFNVNGISLSIIDTKLIMLLHHVFFLTIMVSIHTSNMFICFPYTISNCLLYSLTWTVFDLDLYLISTMSVTRLCSMLLI